MLIRFKILKTVSHARHFGCALCKGLQKDLGYNKTFGLWYWTIFW